MKLVTNLAMITVSALIGGLTVYTIMKPHVPAPPGPPPAPLMDYMPWDTATKLNRAFSSLEIMKTKFKVGIKDTVGVLKGFVFDYDEINQILNTNHSATQPDQLLILFGQDGTFKDDQGITWPSVNLIAVGMKNKTIIKTATGTQKASIFDKADPCPPNCGDLP